MTHQEEIGMLRRSCKILRRERDEIRREMNTARDLNEILLRQLGAKGRENGRLRRKIEELENEVRVGISLD